MLTFGFSRNFQVSTQRDIQNGYVQCQNITNFHLFTWGTVFRSVRRIVLRNLFKKKWDDEMERVSRAAVAIIARTTTIVENGTNETVRKYWRLGCFYSDALSIRANYFYSFRPRTEKPAPNLNKFHASTKEDEIGITEYVTASPGFTGIIKHR